MAKGRDWTRAKQREHERREVARLAETALAPHDKSKGGERSVHPNSMAARKWQRSSWRSST